MTSDQVTNLLRAYPNLLSLELSTDRRSFEYDLELSLSENINPTDKTLRIKFVGVSRLSLDRVGGGLIQFLALIVQDIREQQLDRLYYQVYDDEDKAISFLCRKWELPDEQSLTTSRVVNQ